MTWQGIIFDCDGTLVDSERIANEVLIEYLADFGIHLTMQESAQRFNGVEMKDSMRQMEELFGAPLPEDFLGTIRSRLALALASRLQPVEGVHTLIQSLTVPYCIASNAPLDKIELSLKVTGLLPFFAGSINSAYEIKSWKPDPALFLHAAKGLGVAPQRCVVIEDSIAGVRAGIAAGMTVFAYQPHEIDGRLPSDARIFTRFDELREIFRRAGVTS